MDTRANPYILTKTYIPGDILDSLTNTHIFIPADIEYKHIQGPYTHVRMWPFCRLIHSRLKTQAWSWTAI